MSRATPIPTSARKALAERSRGRCERCGMVATDAHHRRSRSIRDEHTHCLCNLTHLCRRCHDASHRDPAEAREKGWIVSRYQEPLAVPVNRWDGALVYLNDDGTVTFA